MPIYRLGEHAPEIPADAFVAAEATLIGRVSLGDGCSIWPGAVLRGDNEPIRLGRHSNVQEGAVLHLVDPGFPMAIGERVTIGHQAMLHGCTRRRRHADRHPGGGDERRGAGAALHRRRRRDRHRRQAVPGPRAPDRCTPAKVVRELGDADVARLEAMAEIYVRRGERYRSDLVRIG